MEALSFVTDKFRQKMQGWKKTLLSTAGREILIKSVASAVLSFPMSCFLFPLQVCKDLNSVVASFCWGQRGEEGHIHWVRWQDLTEHKQDGGIGFRDFHHFNLALLAKQGWRILNKPKEIWVQLLKGIYLPKSNFLDAKKGSHASWAWSSIIEGRSILNKLICFNIGNGLSVRIWGDPWIPNFPSFKISSSAPDEEAKLWMVADLLTEIVGPQ